MEDQAYLMFELNHSLYGIPATEVQEIFFLPEVTPIAEAASEMLGVINLRGELLPVLDLHLHLEGQRSRFQLTDSMIVVKWQTRRLGIVVNQVCSVESITANQIVSGLIHSDPEGPIQEGWVAGVAKVEDTIAVLLSAETLVQFPGKKTTAAGDRDGRDWLNQACQSGFNSSWEQTQYGHLDLQARQILRERATALRRSLDDQDAAGLLPLAVVGLGGEYFGLDLEIVHEFIDIHRITPIPCCPPHILGNINLRGEIVTLIDISSLMNLPIHSQQSSLKAVVVCLDQLTAGIAVDDILDVVHLPPSQLMAVPRTVPTGTDDYLQGVARYQDKMMSILNLPKILTSEALVVNEEV